MTADDELDALLDRVREQDAADNAEHQRVHGDCLRQMAQLISKVVEARKERDELAARLVKAHETLAIDEFDGDSCNTLEDTADYAVRTFLSVCEAEAKAADQIRELRAEARDARIALTSTRLQLAGVLQFALAWQGQEPPCPHGHPGGNGCGPCSFDRAAPKTP